MVFSHSQTLDAVAADWIKSWEENNSEAMCDLINFVIKCTGCNLQIDVHDVNDPDNAVSKLTDLQDEYQAQKITDYPLISKAKGNIAFRSNVTDFFETLIATCHASGLLYSDLAIIENIDVWVSTMSSSAIRPFRHTATVVSLAIATALCKVANELTENTAKTMRQKEGEQKKKSVNKGRVKEFESKIAEGNRKRAQIVESLQGIFDVVFVHRYRDVDPKIRVECISALGTWLVTLPDVFFEGMYLRYLGWVMSDTYASSRAEVVKQLCRLFKNKDNVARLRQFTERFRFRLVEMSMQDSEVSIRAATVQLLDMIRETGLLEPDDVDNVGRLIFDTEPKVRKAVTGFFAKNMDDYFQTTLEDFGGEEALAEILGEEVDDYDTPRMSWLKLKCVVEALQSYDAEDERQEGRRPDVNGGSLVATGVDSRYALAAQTICDGIPEAKDWEVVAGYLLYDFSTADQTTEDVEATFKARCKLSEKEEILLLEILNVAVKGKLSEAVEGEADKKGKRSRAQKEESRGIQESTATHLANVIPRLLKKFGSNPETATAVLRLEHVLNLEIFQELRQDSTTYASLLDDINKQFLTHGDQSVLAEASTALLHARGFEDLEEVTESKLSELWEDTIHAIRTLVTAGISENISDLCNTVRRIAHLSSISDCVEVFDREARAYPKKKSGGASTASPRSLLIDVLRDPALDAEAGEEAEELLISATKALLFYYMWAVRSLREAITSKEPVANLPDRMTFSDSLVTLVENHHTTSQVRITAVGTYLDLYTLFATFRHIQPSPPNANTNPNLVQHIPINSLPLILSTYTALEKSFARKTRKPLDVAPDDDIASDPEDSSDEEDNQDSTHAQQETLLAERRLCELSGKMILAIIARVLDHEGPKQGKIKERLQRNKGRLGPNFKEVIAYLDAPKPTKTKRKAVEKKQTQPVVVVNDDDEEDDGSSEDEAVRFEEGGEQDLRARELVEDRIVDPDEESVNGNGNGEGGSGPEAGGVALEDEDDIMGD